MSRRVTGWLLLAWALGGAAVTAALARAAGEVDGLLVTVAAGVLLGAGALVWFDERRRRRHGAGGAAAHDRPGGLPGRLAGAVERLDGGAVDPR